ncbi:MAG: four-helix bundle copper-binding protein [Gemmataceae bacterium]
MKVSSVLAVSAGVAVLALGLARVSDATESQPPKPHADHAATNEACAVACSDCQRACDACTAHCVTMLAEGKKDHLASARLTQDCAAVCATAASIVSRGGPMQHLICRACADACAQCGKECDKFDAPTMKKCAEACRRCEKACREMIAHH